MNGVIGYLITITRAFAAALGAATSGLAGGLGAGLSVYADVLSRLLYGRPSVGRGNTPRDEPGYEDRVARLASQLRRSGADAQTLLDEMDAVIQERAHRVEAARQRLTQLEQDEVDTRRRLDALEALKPDAVAAIRGELDETLDEREKRSNKRDFVLFISGVLASATVSVILRFV